MRARLKFTTDLMPESLIGILRENKWWPHFDQTAEEAQHIIDEVRDSIDENDVNIFDGSRKFVLSHTGSECRGTLSLEHEVWVVRLLNPSIHLLQFACEVLASQISDYAGRNNKAVHYEGPVQIVERKRKETIIQGQVLAEASARRAYARTHKGIDFKICIVGSVVFVILLLLTFPWPFRDPSNTAQTWLFSIFEKLIGSVTVTTLIAFAQYKSFSAALRDSTIRWSIPGEPEKHDIKPRSA
jgi:hypothetical protein